MRSGQTFCQFTSYISDFLSPILNRVLPWNRLRILGSSSSAARNALALATAGAVGLLSGGLSSRPEAFAAQMEVEDDKVTKHKDSTWYPNTTTKHWHFYKGKMNPSAAKSMKLFKCAETPIADEIARYLGVELNNMDGKSGLRDAWLPDCA
ncbi:hypothetical protein BBJ28_00014647 [Nothophytophthora sp. Chile5]|nr:hypothetical protein BBJ28_00014647 [Nothophytophthora sp. Chile5]